jgi:hypothetical protein
LDEEILRCAQDDALEAKARNATSARILVHATFNTARTPNQSLHFFALRRVDTQLVA